MPSACAEPAFRAKGTFALRLANSASILYHFQVKFSLMIRIFSSDIPHTVANPQPKQKMNPSNDVTARTARNNRFGDWTADVDARLFIQLSSISTPQEQIGTGWGAKMWTDNNHEPEGKFRVPWPILLRCFTCEDRLLCSLLKCVLPPDNVSERKTCEIDAPNF